MMLKELKNLLSVVKASVNPNSNPYSNPNSSG